MTWHKGYDMTDMMRQLRVTVPEWCLEVSPTFREKVRIDLRPVDV